MAKKTQKGWIKIHKQIKDSAVWSDPLRLKAWIDILISANYEDYEGFFRGELIKVKRGQFPTSNKSLQEAWGCSDKTVRKILTQFKDLGMINVETPHNKYTLITVIKYGDFQDYGRGEYRGDYPTDYRGDYQGEYRADEGQYKNNIDINKNYQELKNVAQPRIDSIGRKVE